MKAKFIPVEQAAKDWFENPEFVAEYEALEEEFALAAKATGSRLRVSSEPRKRSSPTRRPSR